MSCFHDIPVINDKQIISEYFNTLISHSFYPKKTVPTRLTNNNGTLIDIFLCKLTEATLDSMTGVIIKKFSDHQPYFILLNKVQTIDSPPVYIKITKQDKESIQNFYNEILTSNELDFLIDNQAQNQNITYNIVHKVIQNAKNKHMPCKLVKYDKYKHKTSKWITNGIIKSILY